VNIKIIVGAWAKRYDIAEEIDVESGASIADALDILSIPSNEVGLVSLNGKAAAREKVLQDGDELELFPVIIDG